MGEVDIEAKLHVGHTMCVTAQQEQERLDKAQRGMHK